jgi:hemerythrin
VSRKTKAYLQYGTAAFLDVEGILQMTFAIFPRDHARTDEVKAQGERQDVLHPNWTLPSVGIPSMDHEHERCEEALSALLLTLDMESLTHVMEMLTEHFQNEESLMRASGFGNPGESISAFSNHVKDHERILEIGYRALAKLSKQIEPNKSFLSMKCSEVQGREAQKSLLAAACTKARDSDGAS